MPCRTEGCKSAGAGATAATVAAGRSIVMACDLSLVTATSACRRSVVGRGTLASKYPPAYRLLHAIEVPHMGGGLFAPPFTSRCKAAVLSLRGEPSMYAVARFRRGARNETGSQS